MLMCYKRKKKKNILGLHHLSNNTFLLADTSLDRTVDLLCCCLTLTLLSGCRTGICQDRWLTVCPRKKFCNFCRLCAHSLLPSDLIIIWGN